MSTEKSQIFRKLVEQLLQKHPGSGYRSLEDLPGDTSLITLGVTDSIGMLEFLLSLENGTGTQIDYISADTSELVTVNGLRRLFSIPEE